MIIHAHTKSLVNTMCMKVPQNLTVHSCRDYITNIHVSTCRCERSLMYMGSGLLQLLQINMILSPFRIHIFCFLGWNPLVGNDSHFNIVIFKY